MPAVVGAQRQIFDGDPGTVWVNDQTRVKYQFVCALINTCGFCLQYHLKIGANWGIPLHYGCRCQQVPIAPGAEAPHPFVDYRELLEGMPHDQQVAAIGASNFKLLQKGVVKWEDIVTPNRVKDFREVVAIKKLSVQKLLDAGVKPQFAEEAHAAVHTPEHERIAAQRAELLAKITAAGLNHEELVNQLSKGLAARVTIAKGPDNYGLGPAWTGGPLIPPGWGTGSQAAEIAEILRRGRPAPTASKEPEKPKPEPTPAAAPAPVPEPEPSAQRREQTIEALKAEPEQPLHENPAIARAQQAGAASGVRVLVVDDQVQANRIWKLAVDETAAAYHSKDDIILINARSKYWKQSEIDAAHARGWLATNDPNQVMNHEMGHRAHRQKIGFDRFKELYDNQAPIGAVMRKQIESQVSEYAGTARVEFVAEVYAGLKAGKTYGPKIMGYFKAVGGGASMTVFPICLKCKHLAASGRMRCTAFPRAIPDPILRMQHDHRQPYRGDHGIRYEPRDATAAAIEPLVKPSV